MLKRLLVLVFLLGVAGAVIYVLRARSASEPAVDGWQLREEDDESATPMRVREAGSATA